MRADAARRALRVIVDRCGQRMLWAVLVVWLASVGTGLAWLMAYDNTPGTPANAPARWPAGSTLARDVAGPTLVMLAHPRCDCTRASIGELAELLARAPRRPRTFVVFIRPGGVAAAWEKTGTFDQATRIPGVTVIRDDNGDEAERFGSLDLGPDPACTTGMASSCIPVASPAPAGSPATTPDAPHFSNCSPGHTRPARPLRSSAALSSRWLKGETKAQGDANGS